MTVTGIQVTGDFSQTNNCGTVAANGGTCTVQVTFTPTSTGSRTGTITFTDSAPTSPQTLMLNGTAGAPSNALSATSLTFAAQPVGSLSAAQTVTLTNGGNAAMVISGISATGDFSETNNCPSILAPSATCTLTVKFTPAAGGTRTGSLIVSDNSLGGPALVTLTGSGSDFSLTASAGGTATVMPGAPATYQLTFTSVGGPFANQVSLTCNDAPATTTCTISPATVAAGSSSAAVTVTVTTTGAAAQRSTLALWILPVPSFLFFGLVSAGAGRKNVRRKKLGWRFVFLVLLIGISLFALACGNGSPAPKTVTTGTPAGTDTLLITATSGSLTHTLPLTLTVQ
jgi:hypothetical protein